MSPRQVVCGSASNSAQVQLASGRGPSLSVRLHCASAMCGVGPLARTGKSSVLYCPGGRRRATSSLGGLPKNPRVVMSHSPVEGVDPCCVRSVLALRSTARRSVLPIGKQVPGSGRRAFEQELFGTLLNLTIGDARAFMLAQVLDP